MMRQQPLEMPASGGVRRAFVDTRFGQIHIRRVGAEDGAAVPLILVHHSPASSVAYQELLPFVGRHRLSIAVDMPGFGESFAPDKPPTIADHARWIALVPAALGIERFDVMGVFGGTAVAVEMARQSPRRVRRLVLASLPLPAAVEAAARPVTAWPAVPTGHRSRRPSGWKRMMTRIGRRLSFERRLDVFNAFYASGGHAVWAETAVATYPLDKMLPQLTQRTLVLQPEGNGGNGARAVALLRHGRLQPIAHLGHSMLQVVPERIADVVGAFLDEA